MLPLTIDPMPVSNQVTSFVSNLPPTVPSLPFGGAVLTDQWLRSDFTTGSTSHIYILNSVTLQFRQNTASTNLFVRLYENNGGLLGNLITSFTNPDSISTTFPNGDAAVFTLNTPQILDANTSYWLVTGISGSGSGGYSWRFTASTVPDGTGWSIGNTAFYSGNQGGTWSIFTDGSAFQFSVNGQSYPL